MEKRKILISYQTMMRGGSTTSLLSILNYIDYCKYDVDLILNYDGGELENHIPKEVNRIAPAYLYQERMSRVTHRLFSMKYIRVRFMSLIESFKKGSRIAGRQYLESSDVDFYRDIDKDYDVAIAFLEGVNCYYVKNHVRAKMKVAWNHINYKATGLFPSYDEGMYSIFDYIVSVSKQCKKDFDDLFPMFIDKSIVIENIMIQDNLKKVMNERKVSLEVDYEKINIVTTCRIDNSSKALDRAIKMLAEINDDSMSYHWYIIGDGPDRQYTEKLVHELGLGNHITFLGAQDYPYCYYSYMDCFFLPSKYEGKPISVTEALMVALPVVVTNYPAAIEQIQNGVTGYIFDNSEDGVLEAWNYLLSAKEDMKNIKNRLRNYDYSNWEELKKVECLMDGCYVMEGE